MILCLELEHPTSKKRIYIYMCVCVCVCVCERIKRKMEAFKFS